MREMPVQSFQTDYRVHRIWLVICMNSGTCNVPAVAFQGLVPSSWQCGPSTCWHLSGQMPTSMVEFTFVSVEHTQAIFSKDLP